MFRVEKKKHLLKVFFLFSLVDERRVMMSQYDVIRKVYTQNLNNDRLGKGFGLQLVGGIRVVRLR